MNNKTFKRTLVAGVATCALVAGTTPVLAGCAEKASAIPTPSANQGDAIVAAAKQMVVENIDLGKCREGFGTVRQALEEAEAERIAEEERIAAEEAAAAEEEYVYDETYYDYSYSYSGGGYSGGSTATTMHDLVNGQGRAYDENGTSYTYYYNVMGDLDIPGEYKDSDGVSYDGDGYIVVASDGHDYGDVVDTPYGQGKVYDHGAGAGTIDIYVG